MVRSNFKLILFFIFINGCVSSTTERESAEAAPPSSWPQHMIKMADSVSDLIPDLYDDQKFFDKKNHDQIVTKIKKFDEASHNVSIKQGKDLLGEDPLVSTTIKSLQSNIQNSLEAFNTGNKKWSQSVLKNSINHCYRCHTRSQFGPEYASWGNRAILEKIADPIQLAELYVATRQYDAALNSIEKAVNRPRTPSADMLATEQLIKHYISIAARAKGQPEAAVTFLNDLNKTNLPTYLARRINTWKVSLTNWSGKKPPKDKLASAKQIIQERPSISSYFYSDGSFVDFLRASQLLHQYLMETGAKQNTEAYYLLGLVYSSDIDFSQWELPEIYFETCIRNKPHSALAMQCYDHYEERIVLGFSGSRGTFIPEFERKKLQELRELASSSK